jgi:uncharacterized membrane protein YeaQ/YmgE (transglycosylase-associated protein family)
MFGLLGWILFGAVVGAIAKLMMPGRDPGGFIVTILLGIAGAMIGGFIGRALGWYGPNDGAGFFHVSPRRDRAALVVPADGDTKTGVTSRPRRRPRFSRRT